MTNSESAGDSALPVAPASVASTSVAPTWFQWAVFPVTLGIAIGLATWLAESGRLVAQAAVAPAQAFAILAIATLERVYPLHESWKHSKGDLGVDVLYLIMTGTSIALLGPLLLVFAVSIAAWLAASLGGSLWPNAWPLLVQLPLALILGEFLQYWWHRSQHEVDWLWRLHAVHHSAPRLYWLNAARFHPFDILINYVALFAPLVILGCNELVIALVGLVSAVHGNFQHANLQLRCGPLNYFFSMAELHRWHHSKVVAESNHNFGQNLIVWDLVFGTRWLPAARRPPESIGLGDPALAAFPMSFLPQLASPFTWERIRRSGREVERQVNG